jgi:hypothetical protein
MLTLLPKLIDTTTCTNMTFSDKTGTGDNGYAGDFEVGNIHSSQINLQLLCGGEETYITNSQSDAQDLASETETLTITDYEDSNVLCGEYIVFFASTLDTLFIIENGSTELIVSGGDYNDYLDFQYVIIGDTKYTVSDIVVDEESGELIVTLTEAYDGESIEGSQGIFGYSKTFYHAHVCTINKCLHSKIATLSTSNCKCKEQSICKLSEKLFMFFGIDVWMETLNYKKAQEIIDYLNLFCGNNKTDCGC